MKVLFVYPNIYKSIHENLALESLSAILKQNNLEVFLWDNTFETIEMLDYKVKYYDPDFVCFTALSPDFEYAIELAKRVKAISNVPIIIGGPHVTFLPQEAIHQNCFDVVVRGEGDEVLLKYILTENKQTQGTWVKRGLTVYTNRLAPLPDVKKLPWADHELFQKHFKRQVTWSSLEKSNYGIFMTARGCPFKCSYCVSEDTLILMNDYTSKKIKNINIGDKIIGFDENCIKNNRRYYKEAIITNKVQIKKKAYKIIFEDEREIICSENHKWLSDRGWKYTTGTMGFGKLQRPFLTTNNIIKDIGNILEVQKETINYKKGYLSGLIKGDGHLKKHGYAYQFRLCLKDQEPLDIAYNYLKEFNINVMKFKYIENMNGIRRSKKDTFKKIQNVINFTYEKEFYRGFLAGFFDAEGSNSISAIRFFNTDKKLINFLKKALDYFNFKYTVSKKQNNNKLLIIISLLGGMKTTLKFYQIVNYKIKRKKPCILNKEVYSGTKIKKIIDLNKEIIMYDITTTTKTFIANGFMSHNCYSKGMQDLYKGEVYTRYRDIDDVIKEVKYTVNKHNLQSLYFIDETLTTNKKRIIELCTKYKEEIGLPWHCETRANTVSQEVFNAMADAGCEVVMMGIESGSDRVRNDILNRSMSKETIINAFKMAKKAGIKTSAFNICGSPTETKKEIRETIKLNQECQVDMGKMTIFTAFPGSELWNYCKKNNYYIRSNYPTNYYIDSNLKHDTLTLKELMKLRKEFVNSLDGYTGSNNKNSGGY